MKPEEKKYKLELVKWYINLLHSEKYLNYQEALFLINNANHQWLKALEGAFK